MAVLTLHQILSTPMVTRVLSTIKTPMSRFQQFMGAGPGGANTNPVGGHFFSWDIFDRTRLIATGRSPGTGPATRSPQIIGRVNATIYRAHEKMYLNDERIFRTRPLGANYGRVDIGGQTYITNQQRHLAQIFRNNREFMLSRMFRGSFQLKQTGDDWLPVDSGGNFTIDYQIPAGNKDQLDMLGAGNILAAGENWDNPTAPIIKHCLNINAANEELHGYPLRHAWINSITAYYILTNAELADMGGSSNMPFSNFTPTGLLSAEGIPDTGIEIVMRGLPWMRWHVYDGGLSVEGTYTKFIPDNKVIFHPDLDRNWFEMVEGSELVRETVVDSATERYGLAGWTEPCTQPSGFELLAVDNAIPVLYLPKVIQYATVVY
jgi:hypothetical protein